VAKMGFEVESRRKTEWLRRDLAHLGLDTHQIRALPRSRKRTSRCRVLSAGAGLRLCFEGATLGGQVITRHLRREIGVTPELRWRFFCLLRRPRRPDVADFVALLDTFPLGEDEQNALLESARATFRHARSVAERHFVSLFHSIFMTVEPTAPTNPPLDISNCDQEPIHIPGFIQPHGMLLVLREPELLITQASD
jgi:hypothetical protein